MGPIGFDAGSIDARLTVDKTEFDTKLDAAEARGKALEDKKLKVVVDADTALANAKIDETKLKTDALGESGSSTGRKMQEASAGANAFGGGVSLLAGSIVAALPLLPELTAGVVALGGVAASAGAALGGFGAVALTDITAATNATQKLQSAQNAVNNATTPQGRADALIKQKALIDSLGPSTIALSQAVNSLSGAWKLFAAGFTPQLTADVTAFTKLMTDAFPLIQPVIQAGSNAVAQILGSLDTALKSPGAKSFFDWIASTGTRDIIGLATAFGKFGEGIMSLFQAFAPVERLVVNGLAAMASGFATWAGHLASTKGFQEFLTYVAANGPLLTKTLGDIVMAAGHILAALTPLLPVMLHVLDFVAKVISDVPTANLTFMAFATGGLFLANQALNVLIGTSVIGAIKLLGFADAEDAAGASGARAATGVGLLARAEVAAGAEADTASGKVGGLIGQLLKLGKMKLPSFLGKLPGGTGGAGGAAAGAAEGAAGGAAAGAAASAGADAALTIGGALAIYALPLTTKGDQANPTTKRLTAQYQSYLSSHPVDSISNLDQLLQVVGDSYFLSTGQQPGQQPGAPAFNNQTAAGRATFMSTYGDAAQIAAFNRITGAGLASPTANNGMFNHEPDYGNTVLTPTNHEPDYLKSGILSPPDWSASGAGTGNPPAWTLPMRAAGGGGGAGGPTSAQTAVALAQLQGLSIGQALTQAVVTGVDPLTPFFQALQKNLGTAAQGIASNLQTIFTAALQYGQAAQSSLMGSVTGANTVGTQTNVTVDPKTGLVTSTPQSQLVGNFTNTLLTDQKFVADMKKAKALGLAPSLMSQFVQTGPSSYAVLDALVNGDPSAVGQLNSVNAATQALASGYGAAQASDKYGPVMVSQLDQLIAAVKAQAAGIGQAVAQSLTGAAKSAQLKQTTTPSAGLYSRGGRKNF